ncbi:hypothetical protein AMTRI_Chr05g71290 [Amborella trichopoda]
MSDNPHPLRSIVLATASFLGALYSISLASAHFNRAIRDCKDVKRRPYVVTCTACKGHGFYICKLCQGNTTIEWSPLYDPVVINPCLCPTCEGNRVQRCLNCLGKSHNDL